MGKKIGLGIIGLIVVAALYYFTTGSEQITTQMKKQLNTELTLLQKEGFSVQNREIKKSQEHFTLSFDDTAKIAHFFTQHGIQLNVNDAALLQGTKFAVDVHYLPDAYASVSFDIYPLAFPSFITSMAENKKELQLFEALLDKKTFLIHLSVNKLGNGFKGSMEDVNEVLHGNQDVTLKMQGLTFSGDIKEQHLAHIEEGVQTLSFQVDDDINFTFTGLKSNYTLTGKTAYDYKTDYSIEKMLLRNKSNFTLSADTLSMLSVSMVKNGLASGTVQGSAKHISTEEKEKKYAFDDFTFAMKADNFDASAFEKLQQIDVNNQQEINALVQQMISKGVHLEIPTFSVSNISNADKKMGGFNLSAKIDLDKSLDINNMEKNPLLALNAIDANLDVELSQTLFALIAQQPQAMMALMLFQPKDVNGKKVYKAELKDGKVKVNGMPVN